MLNPPEPSPFKTPAPPSLKDPSDIRLYQLLANYDWDKPVLKTLFKRHGVAPWEGPAILVREITRDGSNTILSMVMGNPQKNYREIVQGVAQKMQVPVESDDSEILIERKCLETILSKYLKTAPAEERQQIARLIEQTGNELGVEEFTRQVRDSSLKLGTLSLLVRQIGARATAQIVKKVVARIISRTAAREASKRAAQVAGFAIPLLNAVMIGWTVWDLAGPAYRKTIPTVLEVAMLRLESGDGFHHIDTVTSSADGAA